MRGRPRVVFLLLGLLGVCSLVGLCWTGRQAGGRVDRPPIGGGGAVPHRLARRRSSIIKDRLPPPTAVSTAVAPPRRLTLYSLIFGKPAWEAATLRVFLYSVEHADMSILLIGDPGPPPGLALPDNVQFAHKTWLDFSTRMEHRVHHPLPEMRTALRFKVVDLKPLVPWLYPELFSGREFIGWSDVDVAWSSLFVHRLAAGGTVLGGAAGGRSSSSHSSSSSWRPGWSFDYIGSMCDFMRWKGGEGNEYQWSQGAFGVFRRQAYAEQIVPLLEGRFRPVLVRVFSAPGPSNFGEWGAWWRYAFGYDHSMSAVIRAAAGAGSLRFSCARDFGRPAQEVGQERHEHGMYQDGSCLVDNSVPNKWKKRDVAKHCYCRVSLLATATGATITMQTHLSGPHGQAYYLCHFQNSKRMDDWSDVLTQVGNRPDDLIFRLGETPFSTGRWCVREEHLRRLFDSSDWNTNPWTGVTVDRCIEACRNYGAHRLVALLQGHSCVCLVVKGAATDPLQSLQQSLKKGSTAAATCDLPCAGDGRQICGGRAAASVHVGTGSWERHLK